MNVCRHCGAPLEENAPSCAYCGMPVEQIRPSQDRAVYAPQAYEPSEYGPAQNRYTPSAPYRREKNKWIAFLLCLFFGTIGVHKFYEERFGMGILYLLTGGLFGIGWFVDLIILLFKPNPYYL